MRTLSLSLFFVIFITLAWSQELDNFSGLKSYAPIPEDFTTPSSEKYIADSENNENKRIDKEFFLQTRFLIDELLLSGKVLFNDPISLYVQEVAKNVLGENSELFNKLRFYTIRSNVANAFSTDQGIIFITTGLVARLQNEAQLAFILGHEIAHYTENHVKNGYIKRKEIKSSTGRFKQFSYDRALRKLSVYSKINELEADKLGIELFLKTDYSSEEIINSFDILAGADLPFDSLPVNHEYFNTNYLKIPEIRFPESVPEIDKEAHYLKEGHTHPNLKSRIDKAKAALDIEESEGTKQFIVSKKDFYEARNLARFEWINNDLKERQYADALYAIYLLEKEFPNNSFLEFSKVKSFYSIAKYKNRSRYSSVDNVLSEVKGEQYALNYLIYSGTRQEISVIALRYMYDFKLKYPDTKWIDDYWSDMMIELANKSGIIPADFQGTPKLETVLTDSLSGTDTLEPKIDYHLYALQDLVNNDQLIEKLTFLQNGDPNTETTKSDTSLNITIIHFGINPDDSTRIADKDKHGRHLGIKKLAIVNPVYDNYNIKQDKELIKSENKKNKLTEIYQENNKKLDLETVVLDYNNLDPSNADKYNELAVISDWMTECALNSDIDMISSSHTRMMEISEKYGTHNFLFSGVFSFKLRHELFDTYFSVLMLSTFYLAPLALLDIIFIHNYFQYVAIEINAKTDVIEFVDYQDVNFKNYNSIIRPYVYDVLYQLSSDPK